LALDDDFMEAECVDDGRAAGEAAVIQRRAMQPHLQSMMLTSDVLTAMQQKTLRRAAFVAINGQVYCSRRLH